jgi:hypothetical protein
MLHCMHDVRIEKAMEEAHLQRGRRSGGPWAHRPRVHELQGLGDDAGLDHVALGIDEQRELAQRPAPQPPGAVLRRVRSAAARLERKVVRARWFWYSAISSFDVYKEKGMAAKRARHGASFAAYRCCGLPRVTTPARCVPPATQALPSACASRS